MSITYFACVECVPGGFWVVVFRSALGLAPFFPFLFIRIRSFKIFVRCTSIIHYDLWGENVVIYLPRTRTVKCDKNVMRNPKSLSSQIQCQLCLSLTFYNFSLFSTCLFIFRILELRTFYHNKRGFLSFSPVLFCKHSWVGSIKDTHTHARTHARTHTHTAALAKSLGFQMSPSILSQITSDIQLLYMSDQPQRYSMFSVIINITAPIPVRKCKSFIF